MNNEHKLVIFDLDGTLIDTDNRLANELTAAMNRLGVTISHEEAISAKKDWYTLASKYGFRREDLDRGFSYRDLGDWQSALRSGEVIVYPDTIMTLDALIEKGVELGLLSKATRESDVNFKLEYFGLDKYFGNRVVVVDPKEPGKTQGALR